MIENNIGSGLNGSRRRRAIGGKILKRHRRSKNNNKKNEKTIKEGIKPREGKLKKQNYVRFIEKTTGKVILANYKLKGMVVQQEDRSNYEFAVNQTVFDSKEEAEAARQAAIKEMEANGMKNTGLWRDMKISRPKLTQEGFDSKEIMHRFHSTAIKYLKEHESDKNSIAKAGQKKKNNQPFFMYLSFRAPHRPSSHNLTFDPENPTEFMPHMAFGKPGEQFYQFDQFVGNVMQTLHDLDYADNTLVFFTTDNGPDQGAFNMANRWGHMRMGTMRGKKNIIVIFSAS